MLMGQYNHTVDAKGRVTIPARFREELGDNFVVTHGFDGCLAAYPFERWERVKSAIDAFPMINKGGRKLSRFFIGAATECEVDSMGRILISQSLRSDAQITKDVIIVGLGDRVEIWDKDLWNIKNGPDTLEKLTDEELESLEGLNL